jgi:hypothetical protein
MSNFGANATAIRVASETLFPNKSFLTPPQAALVLGVDVRTIRAAVNKRSNPIPCVWVSPKRYKIPVEGLSKWCASGGMVRGLWR